MLFLTLSVILSFTLPSFEEVPSFQGQIMQSTDGGQTWQNITDNLPSDMRIISSASNGADILVGINKKTIYRKSTNTPNPWASLTFEGPQMANNITGLYPTLSGFYTYVVRDGLYYLPKGSSNWKIVNTPEGLYEVNSFVENQAGHLFIASQNGIYKSKDGGAHWEHIFAQSWMTDLVYQHHTITASGLAGLYKSEDEGQTWQKINLFSELNFSFMKVYDTTFRLNATSSQLFAIRNDNPMNKDQEGRIQFSEDGGRTWSIHPADQYLKTLPDVQNFTIDQQGHWYCSYSEGIIKSEDGGKTWKAILANKLEDRMLKVWANGGTLWCTATVMGC
ncbi:MAG: hypothetical protein RLZZ248_236 [Bacteroidota bacterium]